MVKVLEVYVAVIYSRYEKHELSKRDIAKLRKQVKRLYYSMQEIKKREKAK